jgi:hypothetical protein
LIECAASKWQIKKSQEASWERPAPVARLWEPSESRPGTEPAYPASA